MRVFDNMFLYFYLFFFLQSRPEVAITKGNRGGACDDAGRKKKEDVVEVIIFAGTYWRVRAL
jgi:hypothetical protein